MRRISTHTIIGKVVLTPANVYLLFKTLIALSASSNVAYFTKQLPV